MVPDKNNDFFNYNFNGQKFDKGGLVLAVIKAYVKENTPITYSQLKEKFPPNLFLGT